MAKVPRWVAFNSGSLEIIFLIQLIFITCDYNQSLDEKTLDPLMGIPQINFGDDIILNELNPQ